jgi:TonB family protein
MSTRTPWGLLWSATLVVVVASPVARAQAPGAARPIDVNRRVVVDVNETPMPEIVWQVAEVIGVRTSIPLPMAESKVTMRLWNVRARVALDALCDMVGCEWRIVGSTLRVTPGPPPPRVARSQEFFARLKKPLDGQLWNFTGTPLRDVAAALSRAVGEPVVFEGADPDAPITVNLSGLSPYRAMFSVMLALGWDARGVGWDGIARPNGPIVLRGHGGAGSEANFVPRTATGDVHQPTEPGLTLPRIVSEVKPQYTPAAMKAKIEGDVGMSAVVEVDGTLSEIKILKPLNPDLDHQSVLAAKNWRFEPGRKDGKPVAVRIELLMTFTLK